MSFKYVDPGRDENAKASLYEANCNMVDYILIRDITTCKVGGKFYSDCIDYIRDTKIMLR